MRSSPDADASEGSSWPGLFRPSTYSIVTRSQDVDARHKAGHDD
jgi:hypothetical protein